MDKRGLRIAICLLMLLVPAQAQAQDDAAPVYSVVFPGEGERNLYVATFYTDDAWQTDYLPYGICGEEDIMFVAPVWSGDGRTLYVSTREPGDEPETVSHSLYTFDVVSRAYTPLLPAVFERTGGSEVYGALDIWSMSPDEHYAWAGQMSLSNSDLIDLQTPRVLYESDTWEAVVGWAEDVVVVSNSAYLCTEEPELYARDLATGAYAYRLVEDEFCFIKRQGYLLEDGRMFIHNVSHSLLSVADFDAQTLTPLFQSVGEVAVSDDHRYVAFTDYETLDFIILNLATLEPAFRRERVGSYASLRWEGDSLAAMRVTKGEGTMKVVFVDYALDGVRAEHVVYDGDAPYDETWELSPDGEALALFFQTEEYERYWQVYREGEAVFDTRWEERFSLTSLSWNAAQPWSNGGAWLHFDDVYDPETGVPLPVAVNTHTGEVLLSSPPGFVYAGESPDGAWWLHVGPTEGYANHSTLNTVLLYNVESGETVTLIEADEPLGINWWHFELYWSFVWSPGIE